MTSIQLQKVSLLILLFGGTLFLRGCDQNRTTVTTGLVAPYAEFKLEEVELTNSYDVCLPTELVDFSIPLLCINIVACAVAIGLTLYNPRVLGVRETPAQRISLLSAFALCNSFVLVPAVWVWVVLLLTAWLAYFLETYLFGSQAAMDVAARIYFVLLTGLIFAVWTVVRMLVGWYQRWSRGRARRGATTRLSLRTILQKHKFRFGLRTLIITIMLLSALFAWGGLKLNEWRYDQRLAVAADPRTSPDELLRLYDTGDLRTLEALASNPSAPLKLLRRLGRHDLSSVATNVAANPSAPPQLMRDIAGRYEIVGYPANVVAAHAGAPPDVLQKVFDDLHTSDPYYRNTIRHLSDHASTPDETLRAIADTEPIILLYVVLPEHELYVSLENMERANAQLANMEPRKTIRSELLWMLLLHQDPRIGNIARLGLTRDLLAAIRQEDIAGIDRMVARGADVNWCDKFGQTPLIEAAQLGLVKSTQHLISLDAHVNAKNRQGATPLNMAKRRRGSTNADYDRIISMLQEAGAVE